MNDQKPLTLVTLGGGRFEVHIQGKDRAGNRDGVVHYFHLTCSESVPHLPEVRPHRAELATQSPPAEPKKSVLGHSHADVLHIYGVTRLFQPVAISSDLGPTE